MKINNIIKGLGSLVSGEPLTPEQEERALICAQCPLKTHHKALSIVDGNFDTIEVKGYTCNKCSCYIPAKIRVNDESCPLNKWGKITTKK